MGLGALCCSLLHWFKPGRAVGRASDCQDHRCLSRVGAPGWIGNGRVLEWEGDRQERCRLSSTSIYAANLLAAGKGEREGECERLRGRGKGRAWTTQGAVRCGVVWLGLCRVLCSLSLGLLCHSTLFYCVSCLVPRWLATYPILQVRFLPSVPLPSSPPSSALPCPALPHSITPGSPRPNSILCC